MKLNEEIYLIAMLIKAADAKGDIDLNKDEVWSSLYLTGDTQISEDYFFRLDERKILTYEEVGDEGFAPIRICHISASTYVYFKTLLVQTSTEKDALSKSVQQLNTRIQEILTFDPNRFSKQIIATQTTIDELKKKISSNDILKSLSKPLTEIEKHFQDLRQVSDNYEQIYKNIILPVKEEGRSGVRQTVKWAIISIVVSTILSGLISLYFSSASQ